MDAPEPRPSGSRFNYGYVIVGACLLVMVLIWGSNYCFGIFFKPLVNEFGWTRAMTAGAFSLAILLEGVGSLFVGRLTDRFGPRAVITVGGFIFGLGLFLMSRINSVGQLYLVYGGIIGLALGGFYVPIMATIAGWFNRRRGLMMSIVTAGVSLGTMSMSPLANHLILAYGWRWSFVIFGATAFIGVAGAARLLRQNRKIDVPPEPESDRPPERAAASSGTRVRYRGRLKPNRFWLLCAVMFTWAFCKYVILVHLAPHIMDLGLSSTDAANVVAVMGGTTFFTTLLMGWGTFRIGTKRTFVLGLSFLSASLLWLLVAQTVWSLYLFAVIFSFGFSCGGVLMPSMVADLFGFRSYGSLLGVGNFSACIGCATGPVIAGYLFDTTGDYSQAFILIAVMGLINVGLILLLKERG